MCSDLCFVSSTKFGPATMIVLLRVALRVVGDNEKGYNLATLFLGGINTRNWPSRLVESLI
jgi:hypothetical protein